MTSYNLPANAKEEMLRLKIEEAQGNLRELNISNCIVANPDVLLWCISGLHKLETLKSVACPLSASFLLDSLLRSLENVVNLEFSLVDSEEDAKLQLLKVKHIARVTIEQRLRETKLRKMFVEVAGEENMEVLSAFLAYCPHLRRLHIHIVHSARPDVVVGMCMRIVEEMQSLQVFTLTCEALLPSRPGLIRPLDSQYCAGIPGNVMFTSRSNDMKYALHRDLYGSSKSLLPGESTVLVAFDTPDLGKRLDVTGSLRDCGQLQSLCIVLFSHNLDDTVYPAVGAAYEATLRDFFARLSSLTELNVSSFHFADDIDFTKLLATPALQRLRALCLAPCGMRQSGAVRRLAVSITDIEDLDIRFNVGGRHQTCDSCDQLLLIERADTSVFRAGTGRGRLTFCNVPYLGSLSFLGHCQVPHLRFIDAYEHPYFDYLSLASAICRNLNDTLRSLVVKFANINFLHPQFVSALSDAACLERLCLLSSARLPSHVAVSVIKSLAMALGSVSYMHMHYVNEAGQEARLTWIRLLDSVAGEPRRGQVMAGKPCIMCSTQSFTAFTKPPRREL